MAAASPILATPAPAVNPAALAPSARFNLNAHGNAELQAKMDAAAAALEALILRQSGPAGPPPALPPLETTYCPDICYVCNGSGEGLYADGPGCSMCNGTGEMYDDAPYGGYDERDVDAYLDRLADGDGWPPS